MATPNSPQARTNFGTGAVRRFSTLDHIAIALMVIGGLNWGLFGLFGFDLVAALFGPMTLPSRAVYMVVGLAALYGISIPLRTLG